MGQSAAWFPQCAYKLGWCLVAAGDTGSLLDCQHLASASDYLRYSSIDEYVRSLRCRETGILDNDSTGDAESRRWFATVRRIADMGFLMP